MKKRILSLTLALTMLTAFAPVITASAAGIDVGDYVQMGTYYGESMLWRCVDIDDNGPLMLADKIICLKAFDASGDDTTGSHSRNSIRQSWGSNYWADSNMRSWLNSSASAGNVEWLCGNPPDNDHVNDGYNDYADEAGFMTNFTTGELSAVKEVTQKSILSKYDSELDTIGATTYHTYNYNIANVVQNYDNCYAENITDKFFLLDVKQVNAVYNNSDVLGEDYYIGEPTEQCVANSEYTSSSLASGKKWYYWLRSPDASGRSNVRHVNSSGGVNCDCAYIGSYGVRPAFYLADSAAFSSGNGSESSPYTVEGTGGTNTSTANKSVTVMKNNKDMTDTSDDYAVCAGAEITVGGKTYKTDSKGKAVLPSDGSAKIVKDGYVTETADLSSVKNGGKIYLEKSGVNTPILKSVTVNGTDVRREKTIIPDDFTGAITAEIDWNGNTEYLTTIENGISVWQMTDGSTGTIALGKEFNSLSDISIKIKTTNGYTVSKKLKLKTTSTALDGQDIEISFGDSVRNLGSGIIPYFDDMKFDFDIPNFPCELSVDGSKVTGVFGVDVAEWGYENGYKDNKDGEWDIPKKQNAFKKLSDIIKDTEKQIKNDKKKSAEEWKKLKKQLGNGKNTATAKFGFDADISAVGYIEGTIDQDGLYISSGGIIVSAEAKVGISGQGVIVVVVVPVPYNWEASLKGSIEAQLAIAQREVRSQTLSPQGTLSGSVGLKVGGGPGTKNVHANICGSGSLDPTFTFLSANRGFTLDATLAASLEFVAWKWSKPIELAKETYHIYPQEKAASLLSAADLYDETGFELIGREYLDSPQEFTANDAKLRLFSDGETAKAETVIKTNTYKYSQPKMVTLDGEDALLVWVDEDLTASTINGTSLMYSYFNGSEWTEPQYVQNDGKGDFNPVLKTVGNTAYLAWESAEAVLADDAAMADMAEVLEIKYAVYNKTSNAFEDITVLTNNQYADCLPQISDVDGNVVVTWVSNSENNVFAANNSYSVSYAEIGADAQAVTAASGLSAVDSHCAVSGDGGVSVLYVADTDGDVSTADDNELFIASDSEITQITDDDVPQSAVAEYFGKVYCYDNGGLSVSEDGTSFAPIGVALPNDNYIVADGGNAVYYTDSDEAVSDIYAYFYDEAAEAWSGAVRQTELNSRISDVSGFTSSGGEALLAFNKTQITGDFDDVSTLFGQSDLSTIAIKPAYDISVEYAYADCAKLVTEGKTDVSVDIKNNGEKPVKEVNIIISDADGNELLKETQAVTILSGNTETVEIEYQTESGFDSFEGVVSAEIADDTESDMDNNSYQLSFNYVDVALDNAVCVKNDAGEWFINAALSNNGLAAASDIEVCLLKDGEAVDTKTVSVLNSLETDMVTFDNVSADTEYVVEVTPLSDEDMIGNNDVTVYAGDGDTVTPTPLPEACFTVDIQDGIAAVTNTGAEQTAAVIVAEYDADGTLINVSAENVLFTEGEIKQYNIPQNGKIFVWNSLDGMVPMTK